MGGFSHFNSLRIKLLNKFYFFPNVGALLPGFNSVKTGGCWSFAPTTTGLTKLDLERFFNESFRRIHKTFIEKSFKFIDINITNLLCEHPVINLDEPFHVKHV